MYFKHIVYLLLIFTILNAEIVFSCAEFFEGQDLERVSGQAGNDRAKSQMPWWEVFPSHGIGSELVGLEITRAFVGNPISIQEMRTQLLGAKVIPGFDSFIKEPGGMKKQKVFVAGRRNEQMVSDRINFLHASTALRDLIFGEEKALIILYSNFAIPIAASFAGPHNGVKILWQVTLREERVANQIRDWYDKLQSNLNLQPGQRRHIAIVLSPDKNATLMLPSEKVLRQHGIRKIAVISEFTGGDMEELNGGLQSFLKRAAKEFSLEVQLINTVIPK